MPVSAAEAVVLEAQRRGDLVGVRISSAEDEGPDPWTLPPSRKRAERPIPGPLPMQVRIVRANLVVYRKEGSSFHDAQPVASPWGIPEPRILQGASNEASYFQQATSYRLWRGTR